MSLNEVWSATPTPLTDSYTVDVSSVSRMIEHHIALGVRGIFLSGTCGEGPWISRKDVCNLISTSVDSAAGRLRISVQVTDNSYLRVLNNIADAKSAGADIAVISEPWFDFPRMHERMKERYYFEVVERSTLPVGIYLRSTYLSMELYEKLLMHSNVCIIKDSSLNEDLMRLIGEIGKKRNDIITLTGDEFDVPKYLKAGYSGALCGGAIISGNLLVRMLEAYQNQNYTLLSELQSLSDDILYTIYGGKDFKSWIPGLKYALCKMGIFDTYASLADYPLPDEVKRDIDLLVEEKKEYLFPYKVLKA